MVGGDTLILVLYVNDLFITRSKRLIASCKQDLTSEFEIRDIGLIHYFWGLEFWQKPGHIVWGPGTYATDIFKRFPMEDCMPMSTPMITNWKKISASEGELVDPTLYCWLIGSITYMVNTKPDLCFVVNTLSQYMVEPRRVQWVATKHVLKYLRGTVDFG